MRKKAGITSLIVLVVFIISGCSWFPIDSLPTYERELNEKDGVAVTIDGVVYRALPKIKWDGQRAGESFGEAGGKTLSLCENDPERNFIFVWDEEFQPIGELHNVLLYRTDREIPPPSAESVNQMYWHEIDSRSSETQRRKRSITDNELIKLFFNELTANQDTLVPKADSFERFGMSIACFSEIVPGANYGVGFRHIDGRLVCGNYFDGYVDFSLDVLEQIAGYDINLEELIAGR